MKTNRRPPVWKVILLVLAGLVLVGLGTVYVLGRSATARWERYAAELRSRGHSLTFEEIEAARAVVPEERNAARLIKELASRLGETNQGKLEDDIRRFSQGTGERGFFESEITACDLARIRDLCQQYQSVVQELDGLRDMPLGRFLRTKDFEYMEAPWEHLSDIGTLSCLVYLDSAVKLVDGDVAGAGADGERQFRLADTIQDEPSLISRFRQILIEVRAVRTIENMLRVASLDESQLVRLTKDVTDRLSSKSMKWALMGERSYFVQLCRQAATGTLSNDQIGTGPTGSGILRVPVWITRNNQVRGTELLTKLIDAADKPEALFAAEVFVESELRNMPRTMFLVKILLPSFRRSIDLHVRMSAYLRCAQAALAAERYRLKTGRFPEKLDALVPDYLSSMPVDPFDGKPLRLVKSEDGIVIYSVTEDGSDDGGDVAVRVGRLKPPDIGFRLVAPDRRGVTISNEPPPPGE